MFGLVQTPSRSIDKVHRLIKTRHVKNRELVPDAASLNWNLDSYNNDRDEAIIFSLVGLVNERFPNCIVEKQPEELARSTPVHLSLNLYHVDELYTYPSFVPWHRTLRYFTHKGERILNVAPGLEEAKVCGKCGLCEGQISVWELQPISKNEAQVTARATAPRRNLSSGTLLAVRFFDKPYVARTTRHTSVPSANVNDMVDRLDLSKLPTMPFSCPV